jgi:hypothetical protein
MGSADDVQFSESSARPSCQVALWLAPHHAGQLVVSSFALATAQTHTSEGWRALVERALGVNRVFGPENSF